MFDKESGSIQACRPERSEGSPGSAHESSEDADPSLRSE